MSNDSNLVDHVESVRSIEFPSLPTDLVYAIVDAHLAHPEDPGAASHEIRKLVLRFAGVDDD